MRLVTVVSGGVRRIMRSAVACMCVVHRSIPIR
jgi:hypothetical protein